MTRWIGDIVQTKHIERNRAWRIHVFHRGATGRQRTGLAERIAPKCGRCRRVVSGERWMTDAADRHSTDVCGMSTAGVDSRQNVRNCLRTPRQPDRLPRLAVVCPGRRRARCNALPTSAAASCHVWVSTWSRSAVINKLTGCTTTATISGRRLTRRRDNGQERRCEQLRPDWMRLEPPRSP